MNPPSSDIGPGLGAFLAFLTMALLLWLLMRNMNARMRRMAYRERDRVEALKAEEVAAAAQAAEAVPVASEKVPEAASTPEATRAEQAGEPAAAAEAQTQTGGSGTAPSAARDLPDGPAQAER
jgi:hypothetical protein